MEALSPTMEEGRLVEWKKNVGDAVAVGDVLAEVETDKAVMELVARAAGTLINQTVAAGATVPVAQTVAWIGDKGEAVPGGTAAPAAAAPAEPAKPVAATTAPSASPAAPAAAPVAPVAPAAATGGRLRASPLARRMAADQGVDLAAVAGSGPEGRIVKRDLEGARASRPAALPDGESFRDIPLTQMRKTIARRLVQSLGPIPTYYVTAEADMERAHEAREDLIARDKNGRFSFNDFIIRATAEALTQHPWVNAWWLDDKVRQWQDVHIGVAVAVEDGLITPVVRHANHKPLRDIGAEVRELAGRARTKRLKPEEYTGATFSISNLGMFGIDEFTAIINPPEAAILAVGRIEPKVVAFNGEIAIRRRMRLTMSCDHRVIDGATGAAFLQTLVGMLENPLALVW
jgi:pyruvate dehydrogenase E2 component (dihydrolipoamide acetyltransferase)